MPRTALTDLKLKNIPLPKKGQHITWDALKGFGVRVSQTGTRTFLVKHKNRFITLGQWPHQTLKSARTEAFRIKGEQLTGHALPRTLSYLNAVDAFLEERAPHLRPNSVRSYTRHLKCFHFSTKLAELTQHDLARQLKSLATRHSEHNHVVGTWIIFFGWCIKREYVTRNPALNLPQFPKNRRTRVLTDQELKAVWTAAGQIEGHFGILTKLLILMGQRVTETASIQTSWINCDLSGGGLGLSNPRKEASSPTQCTITFPKEITKNKKEHTIPVGWLAASFILPHSNSERNDTILFPARGNSYRYFTGRHQMANLRKLSGFKDWTLHDLRRTYRTNLARLRTAPHIAERLVNHTSDRTEVEKIYDHHSYFDEMQEAVLKYENWLKSVLGLE